MQMLLLETDSSGAPLICEEVLYPNRMDTTQPGIQLERDGELDLTVHWRLLGYEPCSCKECNQ